MAFETVNSSNLMGYDYDAGQKILHVRFRSGKIYSYKNVEPDVVEGLKTADSKGSYFNDNIKGQYPFV